LNGVGAEGLPDPQRQVEAAPRRRRSSDRSGLLSSTVFANSLRARLRRGPPLAFARASRLIFLFVERLARRFERLWKARTRRVASNARPARAGRRLALWAGEG